MGEYQSGGRSLRKATVYFLPPVPSPPDVFLRDAWLDSNAVNGVNVATDKRTTIPLTAIRIITWED